MSAQTEDESDRGQAHVVRFLQMDAVGSQVGMRMPGWAPQMPIEDEAKSGCS